MQSVCETTSPVALQSVCRASTTMCTMHHTKPISLAWPVVKAASSYVISPLCELLKTLLSTVWLLFCCVRDHGGLHLQQGHRAPRLLRHTVSSCCCCCCCWIIVRPSPSVWQLAMCATEQTQLLQVLCMNACETDARRPVCGDADTTL